MLGLNIFLSYQKAGYILGIGNGVGSIDQLIRWSWGISLTDLNLFIYSPIVL